MDRNYDFITFISKYLYFNFADIIETITVFIETTFKDSKRVTRIKNYVLKCNYTRIS